MCPHPRRQDNKVSFGYSAMRGKRASMEDYYHAQVRPREPAPARAWAGTDPSGSASQSPAVLHYTACLPPCIFLQH